MFVYTVRASTIKFFAVLLLCALALVIIVSTSTTDAYAYVGNMEINYGGIKTAEDRIAFIEGFGLKVNPTPLTEEAYTMPEDFDRIIGGYNEIQKAQGLDLTKYKNKRVTHYAYEVTNYDYDGKVIVNLCIYKNRIIACDISSASPDGFVLALTELDKGKIEN